MKTRFEILLPTYNGERFLPELLDSCLQWPDVALSARDDGSHDGTAGILRQYRDRRPERMRVDAGGNLGVKKNVSWLLERLEAPYFLLADQDDVWEADKLPRLHSAMRDLEERRGKDVPLLVWSDASLIDAAGEQTHTSFFSASGLPASWCDAFRHSLVISNAAGCTFLGNRALAQAAVPIPAAAYMHDWWLLLVAQAIGDIAVVDAPLVRYRQHGGNVLGAGADGTSFLAKVRGGLDRSRGNVAKTQEQAGELLRRNGDTMPEPARDLCRAWATMPELCRCAKIKRCLEYGFEKAGLVRRLLLWTTV